MRILYVTTIATTMGFFPEHIKMLVENGHTVEVACNCDEGTLPSYCNEMGLTVHNIPFSRSPLSKSNLTAYKQFRKLIKSGDYDIVHTHTPNASVIVRLACRDLRKRGLKFFYTAHGFHFYKGAPLKNWLLYYPAEWFCSFFTDTLITINDEDYKLAKNKMHAKKVEYVPGVGIDTEKFKCVTENSSDIRSELNIPENAKLLLSVGELNDNKNHGTVIKAIRNLDCYYIIAGIGSKEPLLNQLIYDQNAEERIKLLGYRNDINNLCHSADVFVFPSFREGLSVSLMEAMACGKPCCVSKIRGNVDLIDENGGTLFSPQSIDECGEQIQNILSRDANSMGAYNAEKIKTFSVSEVVRKMEKIYSKL